MPLSFQSSILCPLSNSFFHGYGERLVKKLYIVCCSFDNSPLFYKYRTRPLRRRAVIELRSFRLFQALFHNRQLLVSGLGGIPGKLLCPEPWFICDPCNKIPVGILSASSIPEMRKKDNLRGELVEYIQQACWTILMKIASVSIARLNSVLLFYLQRRFWV